MKNVLKDEKCDIEKSNVIVVPCHHTRPITVIIQINAAVFSEIWVHNLQRLFKEGVYCKFNNCEFIVLKLNLKNFNTQPKKNKISVSLKFMSQIYGN